MITYVITRSNWVRLVREMKWAMVVKGWAKRVLGIQGVGLQGPRGSRGRPTGSQGVKGLDLEGHRGARGKPTGSRGIKR